MSSEWYNNGAQLYNQENIRESGHCKGRFEEKK
jgi:hypothetical protein